MENNLSLHAAFEVQVQRTPEKVAVIFEGESYTYDTLNASANQVEKYVSELLSNEGGGGLLHSPIPLCANRGIEMVIGILGILKSGAAYVPIHPSCPEERKQYILKSVCPPLCLTEKAVKQIVCGQKIVCPRFPPSTKYDKNHRAHQPKHVAGNRRIACVLYTSGTTGKPKGVCITHHNILQCLSDLSYDYVFEKSVLWSEFVFDVSIFEIFFALTTGSTLYIPTVSQRVCPSAYCKFITENGIQHAFFPPFFIKYLSTYLSKGNETALELVWTGVEKIAGKDIVQIIHQGITVLNSYGPTETTISSTAVRIQDNRYKSSILPIGTPLCSEQTYVLDACLTPVPVGEVGELYIGGAGVSQGYWNDPDLTAARFITNPFATVAERAKGYTRLYKTGDWVRQLPDGNLMYVGRRDAQVKLRGYRIELGEVESHLLSHARVSQVGVTVWQSPDTGASLLMAYLVLSGDGVPAEGDAVSFLPDSIKTDLVRYLQQRMPAYMLPQHYFCVPCLPLTQNGKLDRHALPAPDALLERCAPYQGPTTVWEQGVHAVWCAVFKRSAIDIDHDFFSLGGTSVLVTDLVSRLNTALGCSLLIRHVFQHPTIRRLSRVCEEQCKQRDLSDCAVMRQASLLSGSVSVGGGRERWPVLQPQLSCPDYPPLSYAQERLWFMEQYHQDRTASVLSVRFLIEGRLHTAYLEKAYQYVVARHAGLRTVFPRRAGVPYQSVLAMSVLAVKCRLTVCVCTEAEMLAQVRARASLPFDLESGPLFEGQLFRIQARRHVFFFRIHHLISDGVALHYFFEELSACYGAYCRGEVPALPPVSLQYTDYSAWYRRVYEQGHLSSSVAYWQSQLHAVPPLALPLDFPRPACLLPVGETCRCVIGVEMTQSLLQLGHRQGVTVFMLLFAAFQRLLSVLTGQSDVAVAVPVAGRSDPLLLHMQGVCVNTVILRQRGMAKVMDVPLLLQQVKETALSAFSHAHLPFEAVLKQHSPAHRDPSRHPIAQALFNFIEQEMQLTLPGCVTQRVMRSDIHTVFDVAMTVEYQGKQLAIALNYRTALFTVQTVTAWLAQYQSVLEFMLISDSSSEKSSSFSEESSFFFL